MSSTRPIVPVDPVATDVFADALWAARRGVGIGLDVDSTKAAVDLQNLTERNADAVITAALETLRRTTNADVAWFALLVPAGERFERVTVAQVEIGRFRIDAIRGKELARFPFLAARFEHLRLTEYRDTAVPGREDPVETANLAAMGVTSVLFVALHMQKRPAGVLAIARTNARGPWDVNFQLLLKLIGTSLA
jgi:GAF domain-containing protein